MNIQSLIGKKVNQTQGFLEDGTRVPLSVIEVGGNVVSQVKNVEKEGYSAIQLGFGESTKHKKPIVGHIKKAGLKTSPRFFREIRVDEPEIEVGAELVLAEVFEPGDMVDVSGVSKGKGYAGVVKKWGFAGGPRTHGQSDRERAPGSSGTGTTPGRVYKGKKMSGRMGNENVTVKNLEVLGIEGNTIFVKGLVPGSKGSIVVVKKVGKNKKFTPLFSDKKEEVVEIVEEAPKVEEVVEEVLVPTEEVQTADDTVKDTNEVVKEKVEEK